MFTVLEVGVLSRIKTIRNETKRRNKTKHIILLIVGYKYICMREIEIVKRQYKDEFG